MYLCGSSMSDVCDSQYTPGRHSLGVTSLTPTSCEDLHSVLKPMEVDKPGCHELSGTVSLADLRSSFQSFSYAEKQIEEKSVSDHRKSVKLKMHMRVLPLREHHDIRYYPVVDPLSKGTRYLMCGHCCSPYLFGDFDAMKRHLKRCKSFLTYCRKNNTAAMKPHLPQLNTHDSIAANSRSIPASTESMVSQDGYRECMELTSKGIPKCFSTTSHVTCAVVPCHSDRQGNLVPSQWIPRKMLLNGISSQEKDSDTHMCIDAWSQSKDYDKVMGPSSSIDHPVMVLDNTEEAFLDSQRNGLSQITGTTQDRGAVVATQVICRETMTSLSSQRCALACLAQSKDFARTPEVEDIIVPSSTSRETRETQTAFSYLVNRKRRKSVAVRVKSDVEQISAAQETLVVEKDPAVAMESITPSKGLTNLSKSPNTTVATTISTSNNKNSKKKNVQQLPGPVENQKPTDPIQCQKNSVQRPFQQGELKLQYTAGDVAWIYTASSFWPVLIVHGVKLPDQPKSLYLVYLIESCELRICTEQVIKCWQQGVKNWFDLSPVTRRSDKKKQQAFDVARRLTREKKINVLSRLNIPSPTYAHAYNLLLKGAQQWLPLRSKLLSVNPSEQRDDNKAMLTRRRCGVHASSPSVNNLPTKELMAFLTGDTQ